MLELIALMGGFLGAAVLGLPIAARLARPEGWRTAYPEVDVERRDHWHGTGFEPLDFGPDIMSWPSESPWKITTPVEPLWPSQTWNDTHFGQHWNRDGAARTPAPVVQETATRKAQPKVEQRPQRQQRGNQQRDAQQRQQKMREAAKRASEAAQQKAKQLANQASQAAYDHVEKQVENATGVALDAIPKPAELERLVGEVGLAGTVQIIMKRTNWDFRTAAQYLAKARRR